VLLESVGERLPDEMARLRAAVERLNAARPHDYACSLAHVDRG
jgi:hypothetical protein